MRTRLNRGISRIVRAEVNMTGHPCPIVEKDGFDSPKVKGRSYYWTTPSGSHEVYHPNAYARYCKHKGSDPVYVRSSIRIEVGRGWIIQQLAIFYW